MSQQSEGKSGEVKRFERGVVGFYISCTVVGVAAAVAAMAWIVFGDSPGMTTLAVVSSVLAVLGGVGSWYYLAVSRREQ